MTINIHAKDMELTDSIKQYVEEKVNSFENYFEGIMGVDTTVGTKPADGGKTFFCEMTVKIPGNDLFIEKNAEDLYKAIDKVRDHLKVEFEKKKGKMNQIDREALREQKSYQE